MSDTSETVDIKRVLTGSVSEVPIDALTRRGFKQVKVLNQAMVMRLIAEAVEEVWNRRSQQISEEERRKVIQESRERFEQLARNRLEQERHRAEEFEARNRTLAEELETQRNRAANIVEVQAERDQAIARIAELEGQLRDAKAQVDSVSRELERARVDLENARGEIFRKDEEAALLNGSAAERDQAIARSAELEKELEVFREKLSRADVDLAHKAEEAATARAETAAKSAEIERLSAGVGQAAALEQAVHEREKRIAVLEGVVSEKDRQLAEASSQQRGPSPEDLLDLLSERLQTVKSPTDDLRTLQETIAGLSEKITKLKLAGGGDADVDEKDADSLVAFLEKTVGRESVESNVSRVNVKQKKAGAVKGALDKLKQLQQQGGGDDG